MPSASTRRWIFGCLGAGALAVLALLAVGVLWFLRPPSRAMAAPLPVRIRLPRQGARLAADQTQAVLLEAPGERDLSRFELWVDGELVAATTGQSDPLPAVIQLPWRPGPAGPHTLIARVLDTAGGTGRSRPVVVEVLARAPADTYFLPATLVPGQTIDDLAAAAGISPEAIREANPGEDGAQGPIIFVPVPADTLPEDPDPGEGPAVPEANNQVIPAPEPPAGFPSPVELRAVEELGCEIRLAWDGGDGATSFTLFAFGPGDRDFRMLVELDPNRFGYTDIVSLPATYTYYVRAWNASGITESNLVAIETGDECEAFEVPPDEGLTTAQFEALELITEAPFDDLYCYLGLGASRYVRIPADEDEFLTSPDGLDWDIDRHASGIQRLVFRREAEDAQPASIECWGWQAGALNFLGAAEAGWRRGPQAFQTPGFRLPFTLEDFDGRLPIAQLSIDHSVPPPYDLAVPDNEVDCLAHILWLSGEEIEGGERNVMHWICTELTEDTLQWEWSPSEEVALDDLTGYRIFVNRDYARDPNEDDPTLAGWQRLGEIGSAVTAYPIPHPPCGTTYGYKVQAFIQASGLRAEPAGPGEPPRLVPVPERASEPGRTFTLTGGECPDPRVLVEIALEDVVVDNTWDECFDIDFECEDVNLEAYGYGVWFREDAEGDMTEIATMQFWNERAACAGGLAACLTSNPDGTTLAHNEFHLGLTPISICTPEAGCSGFASDHHRFQTWLEDGDTVKFFFSWWDHDAVSGDDIWCGTTDDGGWLPAEVRGPGVTSFFFGPFSWETWAGFDHQHADNPWDNDEFPHQDAECEIDLSVTGLDTEVAP